MTVINVSTGNDFSVTQVRYSQQGVVGNSYCFLSVSSVAACRNGSDQSTILKIAYTWTHSVYSFLLLHAVRKDARINLTGHRGVVSFLVHTYSVNENHLTFLQQGTANELQTLCFKLYPGPNDVKEILDGCQRNNVTATHGNVYK